MGPWNRRRMFNSATRLSRRIGLFVSCLGSLVACFQCCASQAVASDGSHHGSTIGHWDAPIRPSPLPATAAALAEFTRIERRCRPSLDSRLPWHEVDIPITFKAGIPHVDANWSDRRISCVFDTGSPLVTWPQWLRLDTRQLNLSRTLWWMSGAPTRGEWMLSPNLRIGGCNLSGIPTLALGVRRSELPSEPALGMEAFATFVVTIDARGKRVILRDGRFDISTQPRAADSTLVMMGPKKDPRPLIPGYFEGHKTTVVLDGGSNGVHVSEGLARKLQRKHDFAGMVAGWKFRAHRIAVVQHEMGSFVYLGANVFIVQRISFDRLRGIVLFERYPAVSTSTAPLKLP